MFSTNEGPVVITTRGKMVFVAESFPLPLAHKLTALILEAQGGGGAMRMTSLPVWPGTRFFEPPSDSWAVDSAAIAPSFPPLSAERLGSAEIGGPLSGDLVRFFGDCGVMKSAVDAMMRVEPAHSGLLH